MEGGDDGVNGGILEDRRKDSNFINKAQDKSSFQGLTSMDKRNSIKMHNSKIAKKKGINLGDRLLRCLSPMWAVWD